MTTLFERLGGEDAVVAAVQLFYAKVLADDRVNPFFRDLDMGMQIDKQIAFMSMVFDGPNPYSGKDLATAHAPLVESGLDDTHFDAIVSLLEETLEALEFARPLIDEVLVVVEKTRDGVFGRVSA